MKINELILNIIVVVIVFTIFMMALIFIILHHNDSTISLKDTWSVFGSYFGGYATLTAAYIGSKLFNKWQDQHNKQVNSDFIMKFYDNLFDMKSEAVNIFGFLIDYVGLGFESKIEHYDGLIQNNIRLCKLNDFSMQKLSDLAFILNEDEYNDKFKDKIVELGVKLESLLNIYKILLKTYSPEQRNNLKDLNNILLTEKVLLGQLPDLQGDLYNHYRAFMVELEKYYRA